MNLLTTQQAAEQLGITVALVRRYCRQGRLGQKLGGRYVIIQDDLDRFKKIPRKVGKPPKSSD